MPLSLLVFAGLLAVVKAAWRPSETIKPVRWGYVAMGTAGLFATFPLALMLFYGNTDYRQSADVAVVFGARVYADGHMSDALQDRIRTACELYRAGRVRRLLLSGGKGDGALSEAAAMRRYALAHGVRPQDIFVDDHGSNTEASVRDTVPLFRQWGARRVLAVSHFYHLPRGKLAYERAGMDVRTVPAHQGHLLGQLPYNMAREVAAFWMYYLKSAVTHQG
jgi:vancomycin permeability regulator SanA